MRKFKILFLVFNEIDPFAGGVQFIVNALNDLFLKQGHTVKFMLLNYSGAIKNENVDYLKICDSDLLNSHVNQELVKYLKNNEFDFIINNHGINYYKVLEKLKEYNQFLSVKFKLINYHHNAINDIFMNYENITHNKLSRNNSVINSFISFGFNKIYPFRLFYLFTGKIKLWYSFMRAINYGDANVFHFDSFVNEASNLFLASKNVIYYNILPPIRYEFKPSVEEKKENIILFVGRVELMQKRFDKVLSIWKDCYKDLADWKLVVVGEGDYLENAKQYVCENELMNIDFIGKADPMKYFAKSKIFILTSDFEGLGLVLVEALTQKCVPITFNCYSGIENIIENHSNGLLIPIGDDLQFKNSLIMLATDNHLFNELQENSDLIEERFSVDKILFRWNELFSRLKDE